MRIVATLAVFVLALAALLFVRVSSPADTALGAGAIHVYDAHTTATTFVAKSSVDVPSADGPVRVAGRIERSSRQAVEILGDEEAAALDAGEDGEQFVYRLHGGEAEPYGRSWTPVDPTTMDNPRDSLGLPDGNTAEYLSKARVNDWTGVTQKPADALHGNLGGAPEYVFQNPEQQLNIVDTSPFP